MPSFSSQIRRCDRRVGLQHLLPGVLVDLENLRIIPSFSSFVSEGHRLTANYVFLRI
jgi:hypothetical protein